MPATTHDPVHRARYSFEPDGENLWVDTWLEPGGGLPPHLHPRQEEAWRVLDGEVRFQLGDEKRVIGPADGDMVVIPGTVHGIEAVMDHDAHLRCHVKPARDLQAFLEESAEAARAGLFMKGGIPRSLRGARWAAHFLKQHRDDVVMTFPPRPVQSAMIALLGR
ncbi:MAG: cupin domain-containing protein [Thermoleophilaceae bacterium]|nr:cupin domain-containing protein [Thermoleophilaceae bacterium]